MEKFQYRCLDPDSVFKKCMDPDPDPSPVCPERLDHDPVFREVGSGSGQYQTGSATLSVTHITEACALTLSEHLRTIKSRR